MHEALGIGSQAIVSRTPALPPLGDEELSNGRSNHFPMNLPNSVPRELAQTPRLIIDDSPLKVRVVPPGGSGSVTLSSSGSQRSSSAMHSLMEQGGLVEIGPKADGSPSVITRTIGDALALAKTPEEEAENPADTLIGPPPLSKATTPSHISTSLGVPGTPHRTPSTSETPETHASSAPSQRLSPELANSNNAPISQAPPQSHPLLGRPGGLPTAFLPGLRVLVVDDDTLTRTLMTRVLTRLGCKVSTAENGEVALEMVLSGYGGRFAVTFLDNQMPVMSGLSMVKKLREAGRNDFVVGVTGNALLSDQEEYVEAGVDRCVLRDSLENEAADYHI